MKPLLPALAMILALAASPARADWGPTHWGDPLDAVIASVGEGIAAKAGTLFSGRTCLVPWQPYGSGKPGLEN